MKGTKIISWLIAVMFMCISLQAQTVTDPKKLDLNSLIGKQVHATETTCYSWNCGKGKIYHYFGTVVKIDDNEYIVVDVAPKEKWLRKIAKDLKKNFKKQKKIAEKKFNSEPKNKEKSFNFPEWVVIEKKSSTRRLHLVNGIHDIYIMSQNQPKQHVYKGKPRNYYDKEYIAIKKAEFNKESENYSSTDSSSKKVKLVVSGTAKGLLVTYRYGGSSSQDRTDFSYWNTTVSASEGDFIYLSAQNQGSEGSVKVQIYVNGSKVASSSSSGGYTIATVSYTIK